MYLFFLLYLLDPVQIKKDQKQKKVHNTEKIKKSVACLQMLFIQFKMLEFKYLHQSSFTKLEISHSRILGKLRSVAGFGKSACTVLN